MYLTRLLKNIDSFKARNGLILLLVITDYFKKIVIFKSIFFIVIDSNVGNGFFNVKNNDLLKL